MKISTEDNSIHFDEMECYISGLPAEKPLDELGDAFDFVYGACLKWREGYIKESGSATTDNGWLLRVNELQRRVHALEELTVSLGVLALPDSPPPEAA